MDKSKLNNQIVVMRKYVKQAKVHIINKLVKQVKLLQNRRGNEVKVQKAKRKAERFLEEIVLLKKIKPDDVSKLALAKAKLWQSVLQQKNSTLHDRCIAMLANYGAVQKEVEVFHNANKELKIADLLKQWESKNNLRKDSPKIKNMSEVNRIRIVQKENYKNKTDVKIQSDTAKVKNLSSDDNLFQQSPLINTKHQFTKEKENKQHFQNEIPAKDPPKSNKVSKESCDDHDNGEVENILEIKMSDDTYPAKSVLETNDLSSDADSEGKTIVMKIDSKNEDNLAGNIMGVKKLKDDENEENSMEIEESHRDDDDIESVIDDSTNDDHSVENLKKEPYYDNDMESVSDDCTSDDDSIANLKKGPYHDDMESVNDDCTTDDDSIVNLKKEAHYDDDNDSIESLKNSEDPSIVDCSVKKSQQSNASDLKNNLKINDSYDKKLKEIAVLNLDDFDELDEIPISSKNESDESYEETNVNEKNASQNKKIDPFFLGRGGEDSVEGKSIDSLKNKDFFSRNKTLSFSDKTQNKNSSFIQKQENSYFFSRKDNFQKFPSNSRRDSIKFDNSNFKSFKKDKFISKNYPDKFQEKSKSPFGGDFIKNKNDFRMKPKMYPNREPYGKKKLDNNSHGFYQRNRGGNVPVKSEAPYKKDNESDKPLHPSWEARRKQKEINTSFQGKRIVFNN